MPRVVTYSCNYVQTETLSMCAFSRAKIISYCSYAVQSAEVVEPVLMKGSGTTAYIRNDIGSSIYICIHAHEMVSHNNIPSLSIYSFYSFTIYQSNIDLGSLASVGSERTIATTV